MAVLAFAGDTRVVLKNNSEVPRPGDFVKFSNDSSGVYIVADTPAPSASEIWLTDPLSQETAVDTSIEFFQIGYMNYDDNPRRPRMQWWFGAHTLIDYLGNDQTNRRMWPGTVPEAQSWACKMGIQTAITDIKNNHPNDHLGLIFFAAPKKSSGGGGRFNEARVALRSMGDGDHYERLINSLWFPSKVVNGNTTEIWYDDSNMSSLPIANGSTAPAMAFRLAYNQFSSSTAVNDLRYYAKDAQGANPVAHRVGIAGGLGRRGAQKMIIFETDGVPNTKAYAGFVRKGSANDNQSYYNVRVYDPNQWNNSNNQFPNNSGPSHTDDLYAVAETIANPEDHTSKPGYSSARRPVLIHSIGYGSLFEPANSGSQQTTALGILQTVQYKGNTADSSSGSDFPNYKRIYGTTSERVDRMKEAFTRIMQDGVSVALLQ